MFTRRKRPHATEINGLYLKAEIDFSLFLFKVQSNLYIKYMFDSSNCHSSFIDVGEIAIYNKVKLQLMGVFFITTDC